MTGAAGSGRAGASPLTAARFTVGGEGEEVTATLSGDWILSSVGAARHDLARALLGAKRLSLDLLKVDHLDTAGALAVLRATGERLDLSRIKARPEISRLLSAVTEASTHRTPALIRRHDLLALTNAVGRGVADAVVEMTGTVNFIGRVLICLVRTLLDPRRIRWPALVTQIQLAGLDAVPIIAITAFFIGAVVALLGAHMLERFGAQVFAVELVGFAVLREFGVIITAVLLAGRSASAFAAELGAMRMQQEVDALQVLGVDPIEALVVPRLGALLITMPLLTFVAVVAGLVGGLLVTWSSLGLAPAFFLQRITDNVGVAPLWIGLSKAPIMAAMIAGIGCRQGLQVGGDVQSLGQRVTAAVVHAIFAIIIIDAVFAVAYMELNI